MRKYEMGDFRNERMDGLFDDIMNSATSAINKSVTSVTQTLPKLATDAVTKLFNTETKKANQAIAAVQQPAQQPVVLPPTPKAPIFGFDTTAQIATTAITGVVVVGLIAFAVNKMRK